MNSGRSRQSATPALLRSRRRKSRGQTLVEFALVFPIFIIILVGYVYGRRHNPDMTVANTLNMEVFLPALIFSALAGKTFNLVANLPITLGALPVILGSGVLAWPLARLFGYDPKTLVPPVELPTSLMKL